MKAVRRILTIVSYAALMTGLFLTGKFDSVGADEAPPLTRGTLELAESATELVAGATGAAPLALAVESTGLSPDEITIWLDEMRKTAPPLAVEVRVGRDGSEPASVARFVSSEFELIDSVKREDEEYLIVGRAKLDVDEGSKIVIETAVSGDRDEFDSLDVRLLVGPHEDAVIKRTRRDKAPGIILLAGLGGVFVHLFMAWSRLMVPMREALPPEPELEL